MRIGFVGPAGGDDKVLREALDFLLGDVDVEQAIYLGTDDAVDRVVRTWSTEVAGGADDSFLARASRLAQRGTADEIDSLLAADAELDRLGCVRKLPPAPSLAVEMIGDRIVLVVHDKAVLDEEDIANAHVIVYGRSDQMLLKRFGPRYFFTPGPLRARGVGMLELEEDGRVAAAVYDPDGTPKWREVLQSRTAKLTVSK